MNNRRGPGRIFPPHWLAVIAVAMGCAVPLERSTRADLHRVEQQLSPLAPEGPAASPAPADTTEFDGTLRTYVVYALATSPSLRATFEDWRAASYRPAQARRLPEPTITYAAFIRSVETRVGPQRHRLSAMQWFPWPTKLTAGTHAASFEARAAQRKFEAHALQIEAEVATAYWALWRVHRQREVGRDEVALLTSVSAQVRTRVEIAMAELSDLAQIDLRVSRARDRLAGLDEAERIAAARLVRVLGAADGTATPVGAQPPSIADVDEPTEQLTAEAAAHPGVAALAVLSEAAAERGREARADRYPSIGIGVDWIITGRSTAAMPPPDSGKDAAAVSLSVKVPLWARAYKASQDETRARGNALRARAADARNGIAAHVRQQLAAIHDDIRRVHAYDTTLVPQAQTAFESVLSSYTAGRATVAEVLLAQGEVIGLLEERYTAHADYGTHLAMLQSVVGRPVRMKGAADAQR